MKSVQWDREVSINRQAEASGHHDSFIHSIHLYWALYVSDTLPHLPKAWWTVQVTCPWVLQWAPLLFPPQLSDPAVPPQKLLQFSFHKTACYQTLWAPRPCLILSIVRELESDTTDHFLWIWLTWVTFGHPGTLAGLILNTAVEVKDSSPDMATQDLWCLSYQAASLASQRSHTFSLQHPLHHVSLSTYFFLF